MSPGRGKAATFDLEGLVWTAPDRIEVSGEFTVLTDPPGDAPTLLVAGADRTYRLPAVSLSGVPEPGCPWRAEFAWDIAPFPFETASLELGDGLLVELDPASAVADGDRDEAPADGDRDEAPAPAVERLHLQSETLAAQVAATEAAAEAERLRTELARVNDDLQAERVRHAADSERFREGLATVERSARQALAEQEDAAGQLRADLEEARQDAARLRGDLQHATEETAQARAALLPAEAEARSARAESDRLESRLAQIRKALDDSA